MPNEYANFPKSMVPVVQWFEDLGYQAQEAGDGTNDSESEIFVMPFPYIILGTEPETMVDDCQRICAKIEDLGIPVEASTLVSTGVSVELAYDAGGNVATILVSGLTDAQLAKGRVFH